MTTAKALVSKELEKVSVEKNCLAGENKGMLERIVKLEAHCKTLEADSLKVSKDKKALNAETKNIEARKAAWMCLNPITLY